MYLASSRPFAQSQTQITAEHDKACCYLQVKLGVLKTNKPLTLYEHPEGSYVTCMAASRDGNAVLSGHADGSLHVFRFDDGTQVAGTAKFAQHSCPPTAVAWGTEAVLVTGSDCKVGFLPFGMLS